MRRRGDNGIILIVALFFISFTLISLNYFRIASERGHSAAAAERSELKIYASESQGTIYDRSMMPLVNTVEKYEAAAVPSALDREATAEYALDKARFYEEYDKGEPFVFECRSDTPQSAGLTVFSLSERYSPDSTAQHIIGYASENIGVTGLEYAYDSVLRGYDGENSVTYTADGFGRVMIGGGKTVTRSSALAAGVVTTIDVNIQRLCERAARNAEKGAIVVADVKTGDITAMVSFPTYSVDRLEDALTDERCPLINRALYSYSVGSIFKLVTACVGIERGMERYVYSCSGMIDIKDVKFRCHMLNGHGVLDMQEAMTHSCNTYFISLSRSFSAVDFRSRAYELGFGRETYLCAGMTGSAGVLPTKKDILLPAELANFSFGQGKLTATPLQITALTCAIANGGKMPELRIIRGMTLDGESVTNIKPPQLTQSMSEETAEKLRKMMIYAIRDNDDSNARPRLTMIGAKTSTAQTGRFDEEGNELCHGWITGFFPAAEPKYAVTVLVEDGGYGNDAAAPIFREIADEITKYEHSVDNPNVIHNFVIITKMLRNNFGILSKI